MLLLLRIAIIPNLQEMRLQDNGISLAKEEDLLTNCVFPVKVCLNFSENRLCNMGSLQAMPLTLSHGLDQPYARRPSHGEYRLGKYLQKTGRTAPD